MKVLGYCLIAFILIAISLHAQDSTRMVHPSHILEIMPSDDSTAWIINPEYFLPNSLPRIIDAELIFPDSMKVDTIWDDYPINQWRESIPITQEEYDSHKRDIIDFSTLEKRLQSIEERLDVLEKSLFNAPKTKNPRTIIFIED